LWSAIQFFVIPFLFGGITALACQMGEGERSTCVVCIRSPSLMFIQNGVGSVIVLWFCYVCQRLYYYPPSIPELTRFIGSPYGYRASADFCLIAGTYSNRAYIYQSCLSVLALSRTAGSTSLKHRLGRSPSTLSLFVSGSANATEHVRSFCAHGANLSARDAMRLILLSRTRNLHSTVPDMCHQQSSNSVRPL
jgi:hypothetical protein